VGRDPGVIPGYRPTLFGAMVVRFFWRVQVGFFAQKQAVIATVGVVTFEAETFSFHLVLAELRAGVVAGGADFFLGHEQGDRRQISASLRQMTDGTGNTHGGVDEFPGSLGYVAGGAIVILVDRAGMLNRQHFGSTKCQHEQHPDSGSTKSAHTPHEQRF
jgi:hypothetical protein